jgi:hemerythrin-like domain-containing protein
MSIAPPTLQRMTDANTRRALLALAGAGALLAACHRKEGRTELQPQPPVTTPPLQPPLTEAEGPPVGAVEDLMREHGVIRRVLVVYRESAARLRAKPAAVPPDALLRAARLVRTLGEDFHERQLEEVHLFPAVRKTGGPAGALVDTLVAQHQRGREITDFVLAVTAKGIFPTTAGNADRLARALEAFARMYEAHSAQEDTVVFPAWRKTLSPAQLDETDELFADLRRRALGQDGIADAVAQVGGIERDLDIELASLTAPLPPKV